MYVINILDRRNNYVTILSVQAEAALDEFTTSFENEKELLESLGLNPYSFSVEVKKTNKNEDKELWFLNKKYNKINELSKNKYTNLDFIDKISGLDRKTLSEYFLNELYYRYESVTSEYDLKRKDALNKIVDLFMDEEQYQEKYGEEKQLFTNKKLNAYLKNFYIDNYGKPLYSQVKSTFMFLVDRGAIEGSIEKKESVEDSNKRERIIEKAKSKIDKALDMNSSSFIDGTVPKKQEKTEEYDETYDDIVRTNSDDIDALMTDLDIYMDEQDLDLEERNEVMKRIRRKL